MLGLPNTEHHDHNVTQNQPVLSKCIWLVFQAVCHRVSRIRQTITLDAITPHLLSMLNPSLQIISKKIHVFLCELSGLDCIENDCLLEVSITIEGMLPLKSALQSVDLSGSFLFSAKIIC